MSELAKAVDTIQKFFLERFGLEVVIYLNVFKVPQIEKADSVAKIVATELELCRPEHLSNDKDVAWVRAERKNVEFTIFYPYEEKERVLHQCEQL